MVRGHSVLSVHLAPRAGDLRTSIIEIPMLGCYLGVYCTTFDITRLVGAVDKHNSSESEVAYLACLKRLPIILS